MKNFNLNLNLDLDLTGEGGEDTSRFFLAKQPSRVNPKHVVYRKAKELATSLDISKGGYAYVMLSGLFEFSEFIEAFLCDRGHYCEEMTIATLSLSKDSALMLANCFHRGHLKKMNLLVSDYFFAHERKKEGILPVLFGEMKDFDFTLGVTRSHMKAVCMELHSTGENAKVVMHGSANLRSSASFEQLAIEENPELYDFNYGIIKGLIDDYQAHDKTTSTTKLYHKIKNIQNNLG